MKKIVFSVLSALLLLPVGSALQAQNLSKLTDAFERQLAFDRLFSNSRVKQMCLEWPTCSPWAINRAVKNPDFQVTDAEIERWVSKWKNGKAVWKYRFYVKTNEKGVFKAYAFVRGETGYSYEAPVLIKKFPGHPVAGKPTEHVIYYKNFASAHDRYPFKRSLCQNWPGCAKFTNHRDLTDAVTSQYIVKWDSQGNAIWKRRLYVEVANLLQPQAFYFQAFQTRPGGDYTYQGPVEIKTCPEEPEF